MPSIFSLLVASTAVLQASANYCPGGTGTTSLLSQETIYAGCGYGCSSVSVDLGEITSSCFPFCGRAVATATPDCSVFVSDSDADYTSKVDAASSSYYNDAADVTATATAAGATATESADGDDNDGGDEDVSATGGVSAGDSANGGTAIASGDGSAVATGGSVGESSTSKGEGSTATSSSGAAASTAAGESGASGANVVGRAWGAWAAAGLVAAGPGMVAALL